MFNIFHNSDHTCCTFHRKLEQVAAEGSWQILAMDNDQYDIEYDDDCVPRVDYIDRERDGRLARYAAAAHRTPGNEGFQTQAHTRVLARRERLATLRVRLEGLDTQTEHCCRHLARFGPMKS